MAWTYSGDPSQDDKDQVRFLIQDTNTKDQLFQDDEIRFLITLEGNALKAATKAAQTLAMKFARFCDESVGQVRVTFSQKSKQYRDLAKDLKKHAAIKNACPFMGALTESQKDIQEEDRDLVQPEFRKDTNDFRDTRRNEGRVITEAIQEEDDC